MSATTSATTARCYGIERVCRVWELARSSFYAVRSKLCGQPATATTTGKRGPKTELSDERLLEHIRTDLAESPFQGEGYRKVWVLALAKKRGFLTGEGPELGGEVFDVGGVGRVFEDFVDCRKEIVESADGREWRA